MPEMNLIGVYALTLKNPWADLVARGGKDVENRTWMPHEGVWRLLIHAGKSWDDNAPSFAVVATSAIVAVADLSYACNASLNSSTPLCGCGRWARPMRCHWKLMNVRELPEPVAAKGRMGLWRPTGDVLDAVAEQFGVNRA